jgi:GWxTD domain-containing protein
VHPPPCGIHPGHDRCPDLFCGRARTRRKETLKESLKEWLDGPVHYICDPADIKEFKSLKTDKDRAAFIERFWRRRDPTPNTLVNEYRQLFWNRVKEANEKFLDSAGPGWQTDRGKIYILYGPPDEEKEDPNAQTNSGVADGKGLIRWVYVNPGNKHDTNPVVYVPFVRDVSGEYHVSYDPKLSSPFFTWSEVEDNRTVGVGSLLSDMQPGSGDPLSVMLDLGKMQEVPPQEAILLDSVETVETYAFEPLALAIDRFQPGGTGLLVVLTVAIPGPPGVAPPSILARFTHKGTKAGAQILGEPDVAPGNETFRARHGMRELQGGQDESRAALGGSGEAVRVPATTKDGGGYEGDSAEDP